MIVPSLAIDANLGGVKYPVMVSPKLDGVRALNLNGTLTGRSLDPFPGTGITEGQKNENEAKKNTLGRTERSSAQVGMVPNGQVGSIQGTLVADLVVNGGNHTIVAGTAVTAGSGEMSVAQATHYFENQGEIVGKWAKVKTMVYGVKSLPRFPTFMSLRMAEDMELV